MLELLTNTISQINFGQINKMTKTCSCCKKDIAEKKGLYALSRYWHEGCLKCTKCLTPLAKLGDRFYQRNNEVYCKWDYMRMFGQSGDCKLCQQTIPPTDYVLRFHGNSYHLDCFKCSICNYRFCVGEQVFIPQPGYVLCSEHISLFPPIFPPMNSLHPFNMPFEFQNMIVMNNNAVSRTSPTKQITSLKRIKLGTGQEENHGKKLKINNDNSNSPNSVMLLHDSPPPQTTTN